MVEDTSIEFPFLEIDRWPMLESTAYIPMPHASAILTVDEECQEEYTSVPVAIPYIAVSRAVTTPTVTKVSQKEPNNSEVPALMRELWEVELVGLDAADANERDSLAYKAEMYLHSHYHALKRQHPGEKRKMRHWDVHTRTELELHDYDSDEDGLGSVLGF